MSDPTDDGDLVELVRLAQEALDVHPVTIVNPDPPERRLALGVLALRQKLEEAEAQRDALAKAAEPFARAYRLSVEPFDLPDDDGCRYAIPGAWPTNAQLRALASARAQAVGE